MIKFLRIKNLATIEDIELNFDEGFSILTGETGAGKSIIIDSIRLLLGEKGSADIIRTGKTEASVEAIFKLPQEKEELYIQRQISGEGGGKVYLNGILVPVKRLKEISDSLADIYGQNDHIFLLHLENHLNYLDSYLDAFSLREEVSLAAQGLRSLLREKKELETRERERNQRLDFLEFQIKEIEKAGLKPREEEELLYERNILKNAEKIATLIEKALDLSYAQENSISPLLAKLNTVVHELGAFDPSLQETSESINQFAITIREFSDSLIKFRERQSLAPEKLEELEERLNLIEKLKRKYGGTTSDILLYLENIKREYKELLGSQEKLQDIEAQIQKRFDDYKAKAEKLSLLRRGGVRRLEKQIEKEISLLGMKKARFKIKIETEPPQEKEMEKARENGTEEVEFIISPNPGEELRPLRKIASGGELSRVMLALKTIGKEKEFLKTLIFDEIDSGIGGKTAEFIAQKLKDLSKRHQIICITHLPQIASFAFHHYRIDKKIDKERTFTTVKKLDFEERVTEIGRLISGSLITGTALQTAKEMLTRNLQK